MYNQSEILKKIDACVSCGLCLDVCPTYKIMGAESESPRGRLSLIKGLISEDFSLNKSSYSHLDHCLLCGSCENICPANVEYSVVMDHAKACLIKKYRISIVDRFFSWLVFKSWRINMLGSLIVFYQKIGLQTVLPINSLKPYTNLAANPMWKKFYSVGEGIKPKGDVYLFKGCVASIFDQDTIGSSIAMLNILGFNVVFPENQSCCGSVATHCGDTSRKRKLLSRNREVFVRDIPIIVTSTGCFESVRETCSVPSSVYDIMEFLQLYIEHPVNDKIKEKIMSHTPCSQRKRVESFTAGQKSLDSLCQNIIEINNRYYCCGSAGTYMYRNKPLSEQIVSPMIDQINTEIPDIVLTQNIGCRMQLMNQTGKTTHDIMHPVNLIYQKLYKNP